MSDRGMKKWAPYKTLDDQWTTLDKLHQSEEKIEKPQISNEVAEEINNKLVNYNGEEYVTKFSNVTSITKMSRMTVNFIYGQISPDSSDTSW